MELQKSIVECKKAVKEMEKRNEKLSWQIVEGVKVKNQNELLKK